MTKQQTNSIIITDRLLSSWIRCRRKAWLDIFESKEMKLWSAHRSLELDHQEDPAKCAYMPHLLEKLDKVGLRCMSIPKEYGGGGVDDLLTHCIVGEEISWGDRGATGWHKSYWGSNRG